MEKINAEEKSEKLIKKKQKPNEAKSWLFEIK